MSTQDLERAQRKADVANDPLALQPDGGQLSHRPRTDAKEAIDEVFAGHGSVDQLPELFTGLTDKEKTDWLTKNLARLATIPGGIAMRCAAIVGADPSTTLEVGLQGKPPANAKELHAHLARLEGKDLAQIGISTIDQLRNKAKLGKVLDAVPGIAANLETLEENGGWLHWLVETTDPAVCAHLIANAITPTMADTLNGNGLWSWVDHLRPTDVTDKIIAIQPKVNDKHAQDTLTALVGSRAGKNTDELAADRAAHSGDLHSELAHKVADELIEW
jgi:hypothetical protein